MVSVVKQAYNGKGDMTMKRPLLVFAGQSNMMGAAVFEATRQIHFKNSFEYLHKPKRFGSAIGDFKNFGFPAGR